MLNLYVPYTSYNVLLSLAVAASFPEDDNLMIVADSSPKLLESIDDLSRIFPGNNMTRFSFERSKVDSNLRNFFLKKHNLKILKDKIENLPAVDRIFYIREWNVYTTCAVHLVGERNASAAFNLLEDGIYTYVEKNKKNKNCIERFADKLAYGSWHVCPLVPGALCEDSSIYALFPELLPDIFAQKEQVKIDLAPLMEQIDEGVLTDLTQTGDGPDIEALIALDSNPNYDGDAYRDLVTSLIVENGSQNDRMGIKRHPADDGSVCYIPPGYPTRELSARVPIELYYLRYRKSLRKVVGGLSTALLTARRMLPEAEIESIVSQKDLAREVNAKAILNLFSSVGVKIRTIA